MLKRPLNPRDASEAFKFDCIVGNSIPLYSDSPAYEQDVSPPSEDTFKTNWALIERFLNSSYKLSESEEFCYLELYRVFISMLAIHL